MRCMVAADRPPLWQGTPCGMALWCIYAGQVYAKILHGCMLPVRIPLPSQRALSAYSVHASFISVLCFLLLYQLLCVLADGKVGRKDGWQHAGGSVLTPPTLPRTHPPTHPLTPRRPLLFHVFPGGLRNFMVILILIGILAVLVLLFIYT